MAKENDNRTVTTLGGFDFISDMLVKPDGEGSSKADDFDDSDLEYISPKDLVKLASTGDENDDEEEDTTETDEEEQIEEDETEEEEEQPEPEKKKTTKVDEESEDSEEEIDDPELEKEMSTFLKAKFEEELGWEFGDDVKIENIKDFVDYMAEFVTEASAPQYANDEIKAYDEYIKNGGTSLRDFYDSVYGGNFDLKSIDLELESDQKAVVKEHLKVQGYKDDVIARKIARYEEAGVLEEEALERAELLEEYTENKREKLLETQKERAQQIQNQQRQFVSDVEKSIKELDNIRGFKLSAKEKAELLDYALKPGKDGMTQYQREYSQNMQKNFIESAYLTKNADSFIEKVQSKAASDAYKKVQSKFKNKTNSKTKGAGSRDTGDGSPSLSSFATLLRRN